MDTLRSLIMGVLIGMAFVMIVIGFINTLRAHSFNKKFKDCWMETLGIGLMGLMLLFGITFVSNAAKTKQWNDAVDKGYSFYIDGQEVEPEHINQKEYKATYDDDKQQVLLSHEPAYRTVFFFIPG